MDYLQLINRLNLIDEHILNVYQYGSRVYGNTTKNSDYDFIVVMGIKTTDEYSDNLVNIRFYSKEEFQTGLLLHEISLLECYYLPDLFIWKETVKFSFKLDPIKLRHSLSAKSSNSFVKAKKKLTVLTSYDVVVGKKSLFHAFRIIAFGIQLLKTNRIQYDSMNQLFYEIKQADDDWDYLFSTYKIAYNNLLSSFRLLAPK